MTNRIVHKHTKDTTEDELDELADYVATDEFADRFVAQVEARRARGRPFLAGGPSVQVRVRLDPGLNALLVDRTATTGRSTSDIVRAALRDYLLAD